jgi:hypothetical protein
MRQSPCRFTLDAPLIPIGVLGAQMAQDHAAGAAVHPAGDAEALRSPLGTDDVCHLDIHHLNEQWR